MNVSNGGLIAQLGDCLYVCDLSGYGGTLAMSQDGATAWEAGAVMWFAASDGRGLYCSNQKDYDCLTYLNGKDRTETRLLKRACANLVMLGGKVLYIDEEDGFIYIYDPVRSKSSLVIKERASSFILVSDTVYFASESGLKRFSPGDRRAEKLANCYPVSLNFAGGQLIFADARQDYALCRYDFGLCKLVVADGIRTQSVIATDEYIFACDLADGNSIVRASLATGAHIRFCGECADKLHVIGEHLFFLNRNDGNAWYRVSVSGGRPTPVRAAPPASGTGGQAEEDKRP